MPPDVVDLLDKRLATPFMNFYFFGIAGRRCQRTLPNPMTTPMIGWSVCWQHLPQRDASITRQYSPPMEDAAAIMKTNDPYDAYVLLALQPRSSCIARWWIKAMDPGKESTLQCLGFAPDQSYL